MAFRSDLEAAHARVKALEQQLAAVDAENQRLRAGAAAGPAATAVVVAGEPRAGAATALTTQPAAALMPVAFRTGVGLMLAGGLALGALLSFDVPAWLTLLVGAAPAMLGMLVILAVVRLGVAVRPGELVVLIGRPRRLADGSQVDFRLLRAGSTLRFPLLEAAHCVDLQPVHAALTLHSVHCQGGTVVSLQVKAEARFSADEHHLTNVVERLLGVSRADLTRLVASTLERVVREVMAKLSASALTSEPGRAAQAVTEMATDPLHAYGLELATLVLARRDDGVDGSDTAT